MEGNGTDRSFTGDRFSDKSNVRGSVSLSKNFFMSSISGGLGKTSFGGNVPNGGGAAVDAHEMKANLLSTPSSKKSDDHDMPNIAGMNSPS